MADGIRDEQNEEARPTGPARLRRLYLRPTLTEFGSVHDLTRGNSVGNCLDNDGKRRKGQAGAPGCIPV